MVSFTCDYCEGAHPAILERLAATNMLQTDGYGEDPFTLSACKKIREQIGCSQADVYLLVGGTQTNATVIDSIIRNCEGVIASETGHIAVHESGAVEMCGHKVITLQSHEGKMKASELNDYLEHFYGDPTWQHMVIPGMVYISFPTEYGTLYTKKELKDINKVAKKYDLPVFIDGARLGYGLASESCDSSISDIAQLCDVFYIGGTKIGALCGEAVVFPRGDAPKNFFSIVKQHGALLAKGRLLGIQFDTLFTGNLYLKISKHAVDMAMRLKSIMKDKGIGFYIDSSTNQQFPILSPEQMKRLDSKVKFEIWETLGNGSAITRFATSWATKEENIELLDELL